MGCSVKKHGSHLTKKVRCMWEDFKRDLEEYIVHWNTRRSQVRLKGLTPEEFRNQAFAA